MKDPDESKSKEPKQKDSKLKHPRKVGAKVKEPKTNDPKSHESSGTERNMEGPETGLPKEEQQDKEEPQNEGKDAALKVVESMSNLPENYENKSSQGKKPRDRRKKAKEKKSRKAYHRWIPPETLKTPKGPQDLVEDSLAVTNLSTAHTSEKVSPSTVHTEAQTPVVGSNLLQDVREAILASDLKESPAVPQLASTRMDVSEKGTIARDQKLAFLDANTQEEAFTETALQSWLQVQDEETTNQQEQRASECTASEMRDKETIPPGEQKSGLPSRLRRDKPVQIKV